MCIHCAQAEANTAIGLDLGTSRVRVAVWQDSRLEAVPNDRGQLATPSSVAFLESGERLVGAAAHTDTGAVTRETVRWAPRLLVPPATAPARLASGSVPRSGAGGGSWPVHHAEADRPDAAPAAGVRVEYSDETQVYTAEQVVAIVLGAALKDAETYLGAPPTRTVVAVPVWYGTAQRAAVAHACRLARLDHVELVAHSTAASVAYGLQQRRPAAPPRTTLVLDLGSGSLDVALLTAGAGGPTVAAVAGAALGGLDWDARLVELVWQARGVGAGAGAGGTGRPVLDVPMERQLLLACEQARRELSSAEHASVALPLPDAGWEYVLTRAEMEAACADLFAAVLGPVDEVLRDAQLAAEHVDEVVLLGGASRMPRVRQLVAHTFPGRPVCVPDEAELFPSYGAAVQAAIADGVTAHRLHDDTAASPPCCAPHGHDHGHGHGHGQSNTQHPYPQEASMWPVLLPSTAGRARRDGS